jgi:hypothetical protein
MKLALNRLPVLDPNQQVIAVATLLDQSVAHGASTSAPRHRGRAPGFLQVNVRSRPPGQQLHDLRYLRHLEPRQLA